MVFVRREALALSFVLPWVACSSTPTQTSDDGGIDAQSTDASDAVSDAQDGGCVVQTCNGVMSLFLGQTVPYGDGCGDTCSYKSAGGGLTLCGCSYTVDCPCPDGGDQ